MALSNRISRLFLLLATLSVCVPGVADAATYYVATNGSDGASGSSAAPWQTIGYGMTRLASGDTLIVRPGTYFDRANFINTHPNNGRTLASGTASAYTTIRAETPFTVRVRNTTTLNWWDSMIFLQANDRYIHIDGFIFDITNSRYPGYNASVEGSYNRVTRTIFRRAGGLDPYGGWVAVGGDHNLFEDCAGVGMARYGFIIGGPTSSSKYNIFRRCIGRIDYGDTIEPKATFAVYGNDQTNPRAVSDHLFQNCLVIDGRRGPDVDGTYGGFYFPKNVNNVTIQGSIILNNEALHGGYFISEMGGRNMRLEHSIAWDIYGPRTLPGLRANGGSNSDPTDYLIYDHMTVGRSRVATMEGYYNRDNVANKILTNSLFYNYTSLAGTNDFGWATQTNNIFAPATADGVNPTPASLNLRYLVRAETGSPLAGTGSGGSNVGATVLQRYGISGTHWGQAGYNTITTEPLWPWPYESQIKAVFIEPNTPPPGSVPSTNDTTRGFGASTDAWGQPMTLTRYIWQYLGNQIPSTIYGTGQTLPAPTGIRATVVQ